MASVNHIIIKPPPPLVGRLYAMSICLFVCLFVYCLKRVHKTKTRFSQKLSNLEL